MASTDFDMDRFPLQAITIQGDGKWLEEVFPETKWQPIVMPLINKEDIKPIKINADKHKFKFATPLI